MILYLFYIQINKKELYIQILSLYMYLISYFYIQPLILLFFFNVEIQLETEAYKAQEKQLSRLHIKTKKFFQ